MGTPSLPDINSLIEECRFETTRSGGKGGQNVNKVETKVILLLDVLESKVLDDEQKNIILDKLHTRTSKHGLFRISASRGRTQLGNRKIVIEKFIDLITKAFEVEEERIATKPTYGSKVKRIENKKAVSSKKASRSQNWDALDEV